MTPIAVSAPGKLMIAGEYAVLSGHRCLVLAVDRRAVVTLGSPFDSAGSQESPPVPPEALLARKRAESRIPPAAVVPEPMHVDVTPLRMKGLKLGLGSSAAAAAATAGAVLAAAGRDLDDPETRADVLAAALEGHRAVAPEGSGADVAASVIGGLVDYRMGEPPKKLVWPDRVRLSAVWTGAEARTSDLVAKVSQLRERDRETHDAALARIADASRALSAAMADNDAPRSIEAMRIHHDAMAALGRDAGAPIVEERLRAVAEAARAAGGAAKPAGAGGGDVAIALFSSVDDQKRFEDACSARGLTLLSLVLASEGVRRERAAER